MIFVCLGTQTYPFDRLLKELDKLVENRQITDEILVQSGTLNYIPQHLKYIQFLAHDEFDLIRKKADLIISHGGTGALIGASKLGKNIIAVPRLSEYGEHIDNHQLQIVKVLEEQGYIRAVYHIDDLLKTINEAIKTPISKIYRRESNVLTIIEGYIDELCKKNAD